MTTELHALESRVLLHAPTGRDAQLVQRVLGAGDIESVICDAIEDVLAELEHGAGALLLQEEALTPVALKLLGAWIASQPHWSDIPILVVTHQGADSPGLHSVMEALRNLTLLERPVRTRALISAVKSALNARMRQYQVREAEQRKDEFLASLAHELRNPLAPIRTSMSVLSLMYPAASGVSKVCDVVERQIGHLTRLVDDLLDVARITSGKIVLQREPVLLSAIISHAMEICAPMLEGKPHALKVSQPREDVMLDADQVRLVQSLANVLGNAIKFTPSPGEIALAVEVRDKNVTFRVRDSGIGLEPAAIERIFEMFAQGLPSHARSQGPGGLGIGLSLARRFVEMHGGTITASSDGPGKGSVFTMTLPVVTGVGTPSEKASVPTPSIAANRRVLVVDDNRDGADMLQQLLEADGFTVDAAYSGVDALQSAAAHLPDIVVMDIGMPGMDGYEAARHIRALPGGKDILIIAVTGWGQDSAKLRSREAGFDHHLVKPVRFDQIRSFLERA
ncbi:hybrid sensor histidine kinase/response regulator [Noviherbaspirillum sp. ST9]|uniref:hybrid sensor histidine kinase/response regulator n=1 Tax=Noviherbaspirillum sp. ST9 TaxID=3401606 RepID=UPI003B587E51